jgi:hypothetical protein
MSIRLRWRPIHAQGWLHPRTAGQAGNGQRASLCRRTVAAGREGWPVVLMRAALSVYPSAERRHTQWRAVLGMETNGASRRDPEAAAVGAGGYWPQTATAMMRHEILSQVCSDRYIAGSFMHSGALGTAPVRTDRSSMDELWLLQRRRCYWQVAAT